MKINPNNKPKIDLQVNQELCPYPSLFDPEIEFRDLVEFAPDAIYIYCGETVVFANQSGASLLGAENPAEIIGKSLKSFIHPKFWGITAKRVWQLQNWESVPSITEKFIRIDGQIIDVEVASVPLLYQGKLACQVAVRDITRRRQLERELKKRVQFEKLITSISTNFINLRPHEVENEVTQALKMVGEFAEVNLIFVVLFYPDSMKLENIFGWAREGYQIRKESYLDKSLNVDYPWFADHIKQMDKVLITQFADLPLAAIGEKQYYLERGISSFLAVPMVYGKNLIGFLGAHSAKSEKISSTETITLVKMVGEIIANALEHKRAAEELLISEQCFYKAFNSSSSLITMHSLKDGRYLNANEGFLNTTGYRREEVINKPFLEVDIWVGNEHRNKLKQLMLEQVTLTNQEFLFRTKAGAERIGLVSTDNVTLNGLPYIMTSIIDITERKRIEQEIAKLERLNLIGEMAAGIGHEIRNPLTTVRGFLQVLGDKPDCLPYKEYFELMIDELDRANSIITEYLSLAKNKPVVFKQKNLNSLINALFPLMMADAMTINKSIQAELGVIPDLFLDEKEIRQLILNIVRNGLEAMSSGGKLTIKTYLEDQDVVLAVQDQGIGIAIELLEKLGTPFLTTKEQGTGLGLAVCYSIVARHKGLIKVATSPDGTTFYIKFKQSNPAG